MASLNGTGTSSRRSASLARLLAEHDAGSDRHRPRIHASTRSAPRSSPRGRAELAGARCPIRSCRRMSPPVGSTRPSGYRHRSPRRPPEAPLDPAALAAPDSCWQLPPRCSPSQYSRPAWWQAAPHRWRAEASRRPPVGDCGRPSVGARPRRSRRRDTGGAGRSRTSGRSPTPRLLGRCLGADRPRRLTSRSEAARCCSTGRSGVLLVLATGVAGRLRLVVVTPDCGGGEHRACWPTTMVGR